MNTLKIILNSNILTIIKLFLLNPLLMRIKIKVFGYYSPKYYPKKIFNCYKMISTKNSDFIESKLLYKVFKKPEKNFQSNSNAYLQYSNLNDYWISTNKDNKYDTEIINASHRFFWLLSDEIKNVHEKEKSITNWLEHFQKNTDNIAWHPYNVSERICNWIIFIGFFKPQNEKKIVFAINQHVNFLIHNLEYPASGITNNHILNNARALYFSGSFLSRNDVRALSILIFKEHLPDLISPNGFLNECSTHYHFLVHRWTLECSIISQKNKDDVLKKILNPYILNINNASIFFKFCKDFDFNLIPKIGDLSPDMPFNWFNPISNIKKNWQMIWNHKINKSNFKKKNVLSDGWIKHFFQNWLVFAFTHPNKNSYPSGHGHNDFSSFNLFYNSHPILIDIGSKSYDLSSSDYFKGKLANHHSSLMIDNQNIIQPGTGYKSLVSSEIRRKAMFQKQNNQLIWSGETLNKVKWQRRVYINKSRQIEIQDTYSGKSNNILESNFYLYEKLEFISKTNNSFLFKLYNNYITFKFPKTCRVELSKTSFFENYGTYSGTLKLKYSSLNFNKKVNLKVGFLKGHLN